MELKLVTSGNLTTQNINYLGATNDIVLQSGGMLTVQSNSNIYGKNVTLTADKLDIQSSSSVNSGGSSGDVLWVQPKTSLTKVDLGSGSDLTAGTLELSIPEVNALLAGSGTLRIGCGCSGDVHFSGDVNVVSNSEVFEVESGAAITQGVTSGAVQAGKLLLKAKGNVDLDKLSNSVASLAGAINGSGAEHFSFKNSGNLIVDVVGGTSGISISGFSAYSAGSPDGVITLDASGTIGQAPSGNLGGAAVLATSSSGSVNLTAASNPTGIVAGSAYSGFSYKSANQIALMDVNGHEGISTTMYGNIVLEGTGFSNNLTTPFSVGAYDRWLVYLPSPNNVSKGSLTSDFRKYGKTLADYPNPGETGNGFIYASMPGVLNVNTTRGTGATSHTYGSTPDVVWGYAVANASSADSEDYALTRDTHIYADNFQQYQCRLLHGAICFGSDQCRWIHFCSGSRAGLYGEPSRGHASFYHLGAQRFASL
ncbi:MAG: hypothetical protein IPG23_19265 [Burkholderiales bacterium]|nr:hypothetical protein [Burkholderiales bacterium]